MSSNYSIWVVFFCGIEFVSLSDCSNDERCWLLSILGEFFTTNFRSNFSHLILSHWTIKSSNMYMYRSLSLTPNNLWRLWLINMKDITTCIRLYGGCTHSTSLTGKYCLDWLSMHKWIRIGWKNKNKTTDFIGTFTMLRQMVMLRKKQ